MSLRPVTAADALTIAFHRYPDEADAAEQPIYAAWVEGAIERGVYLGFVWEEGGVVVSGAGLTLLEWGPSRGNPHPFRARVVNVWTHPDHRRQGLARALVVACLKVAEQRGISWLSLSTSEMARPLYEELGFQASLTEMLRHQVL